MRKRRESRIRRIVLLTTVSMFLVVGGLVESKHFRAVRSDSVSHRHDDVLKKYSGMPLYFERNLGQSDPSVRYLSHSSRSSLFLTDDAAVITMVGGGSDQTRHIARSARPAPTSDKLIESAVRIRLIGANPHPQFEALEALRGRVNYIIGNDPSKYHRNVPIFGRIKEKNVYPGIDLVYYGTPQALEYDLIAAPGADTSKLKFAVEGGDKTEVDQSGNLIVTTPAGLIVLQKPRVYQQDASGGSTPIDGAFAMAGDGTIEAGIARHEVSFEIAAYDHRQTLMVDPPINILVYSTYLGGVGEHTGPFPQPELTALLGSDLPLTAADIGTAVAVDSNNFAYVTGLAYSKDFPTTASAFQGGNSGFSNSNPNAFISKLDYSMTGDSSLVYSTYIGGSGRVNSSGHGDVANGITVDASGNAFIVGQTYSSNFPGSSDCDTFGTTYRGSVFGSGFVAKLEASGSTLDYSCYIGGNAASGNPVAAMEAGVALKDPACGNLPKSTCNVFIVGSTAADSSSDYPVSSNAFQSSFVTNGIGAATFFDLVDQIPGAPPIAPTFAYSTLYGGSGNNGASDFGLAVASDPSGGNGFITGATFSSDLTVPGAQVNSYNATAQSNGTSNVFVAEFNPAAAMGPASLVYGTYLGGSGAVSSGGHGVGDAGTAIAFNSNNGSIWVTGYTASTDFQVPGGATQIVPSFQGNNNAAAAASPATAAFVTELNPAVSGLGGILYSTYLSGHGTSVIRFGSPVGFGDAATGIAVSGGNVYVTGLTTSGGNGTTFPLPSGGPACFNANNSTGFHFGGQVPTTAFVFELNPSQLLAADQLANSYLLGGSGAVDIAGGVAVDSNGNIVVAGLTFSTDFPVLGAFQSSNNATGNTHSTSQAFLTVLNPSGVECPPTPTATATATATATSTGTATSTATATLTATETPTATETATATQTETATATSTATTTATATVTATATATETATATVTETATATLTTTQTPTPSPTGPPTATSTQTSSASPTPTLAPTPTPTSAPTSTPTLAPTPSPSSPPTPSATSTAGPTGSATIAPTAIDSATLTVTATPTPVGGGVDLIEPASGGGSPGADVSLGSVGYTSNTVNQQIISSVSVTVTHPKVFSSLSLSAFLNTVPVGSMTVTAPNITSTTIFTFSAPIIVPSGGGQALTFTFNGVISGGQGATLDIHNVKLAGVFVGRSSGGGTGSLLFSLSLLGFVMVPLSNKQRRRASFLAAALLIMATAMVGCGGGGSSGGAAAGQPANKSTQQIVAVDVTESGNPVGVANLPIDLGTVTKK